MQMKIEDRAQFIDRSLDKYFECMSRDDNHDKFQEFCEKLGYGAVSGFLSDPNSFMVVSGGESIDTSLLPNSAIPVVPLGHEESISVHAEIHPLQRQNSSMPGNVTRELFMPDDVGTIATIWTPTEEAPDIFTGRLLIQGHYPVFTVNTDLEYGAGELICPTVVGHEIVHLAQALVKPCKEYYFDQIDQLDAISWLESEVEAYTRQDSLFESMMDEFGRFSSISLANAIASIRQVTMKDSFIVNEAFIERASRDPIAAMLIPEILLPGQSVA